MPLSEHEERILAEIERQLAAEDPRFVARARRRRLGRSMSRQSRIRGAIALAIVGAFCVVLLGFIEGPTGVVLAAIGLSLVFVSLLLGLGALTEKSRPEHASVPPDERT